MKPSSAKAQIALSLAPDPEIQIKHPDRDDGVRSNGQDPPEGGTRFEKLVMGGKVAAFWPPCPRDARPREPVDLGPPAPIDPDWTTVKSDPISPVRPDDVGPAAGRLVDIVRAHVQYLRHVRKRN